MDIRGEHARNDGVVVLDLALQLECHSLEVRKLPGRIWLHHSVEHQTPNV